MDRQEEIDALHAEISRLRSALGDERDQVSAINRLKDQVTKYRMIAAEAMGEAEKKVCRERAIMKIHVQSLMARVEEQAAEIERLKK